jgi:hypothetical protein
MLPVAMIITGFASALADAAARRNERPGKSGHERDGHFLQDFSSAKRTWRKMGAPAQRERALWVG